MKDDLYAADRRSRLENRILVGAVAAILAFAVWACVR